MNVILFLFGFFIANVIEYCVHRFLFHGMGRNKKSIFAFHLREHHRKAVRNGFVDEKLSAKEWIGIPVLLILLLPVYYLSFSFYFGISLYAVLFVVIHNIQHKYPKFAKKYFWWHWNHHMRNPNKSWAVVVPITDIIFGTLQKR